MSVIYTETVRRNFTEHRQRATEALGSPQEAEDYFRQLGAQIEEQVQQSEDQIAGRAPVGETYLQHVGRLRIARAQAQPPPRRHPGRRWPPVARIRGRATSPPRPR